MKPLESAHHVIRVLSSSAMPASGYPSGMHKLAYARAAPLG